ncbi:MAG: histidine--tRNA ligase [Flavobacteriales bacterium]|jgi:histidyl-tRNA synthetase|tara:strand:+ start:2558 stop:3919 length:1362 start_codon:yes stop_codon:yes gene_type:complete
MAQKPSIPKGTRDFSPAVMLKRNYLMGVIKKAFQTFGYLPIETPSMENLSTLMGKYGEEGDRLIFKILNSGDYLKKVDASTDFEAKKLTSKISEKALRYDLTVPFARYVVQNQNEITLPFKRFQIQPVWRADRPQKGRFREFYQCDADVVGSKSLLYEVELIQLYDTVFTELNLPAVIKLNNRKVLSGIAEVIGEADKLIDITVAIDKLDKIGLEKVKDEMQNKGVSDSAIEKLDPILKMSGNASEKLVTMKDVLSNSPIGLEGIDEIQTVIDKVMVLGLDSAELDFDLTLARGLNYYTGSIFEIEAKGVQMGSIGGGGRYDDLTGIFGLKDMPGIGISFGLDRIYLVVEELGLFPSLEADITQVLFVNFGDAEADYCLKALRDLRKAGINSELYPDAAKMKKQMNYANNKGIPYVVLVGEDEMNSGLLTVKNMNDGTQENVTLVDLIKKINA